MDDKGERSMSHSRKESWEEETEEERGKRARYESSSVELEIKLDRPLTELDPPGSRERSAVGRERLSATRANSAARFPPPRATARPFRLLFEMGKKSTTWKLVRLLVARRLHLFDDSGAFFMHILFCSFVHKIIPCFLNKHLDLYIREDER
ncbi:hypothetical protein HPP92_028267 [Vanilla planifolia]|uniref:Uncharacterized protein n=1 Tax=Vanilla planifolia TaxID=51239 RepID=A0A835P9S8_VANPL|nr:hypothetical protein HPP92_028267 [Vanilla planifolia]